MGDESDDASARDEELYALEAIFGESVNVSREDALVEGGTQEVILRASLPADYPSASCPVALLFGSHLSDDVLRWAARQLEAQFTPGEVTLYNWVEWVKEQELLWAVPAAPPQQQQQRGAANSGGAGEGQPPHQDGGTDEEGGAATRGSSSRKHAAAKEAVREAEVVELLRSLRVTSGEPYVEKKSTFQAHVAPVSSFDDVRAVMDALLSISKIRAATHNIMAYRIHTPGAGGAAGSFLQDYDDDGETAAGGRLLHLLQAADVRNAVVVVSRWFGGVLMGPGRFTAINNTARALLEQMGLVAQAGGGGKGGAGHGGGGGGKGGRRGG